MAESFIQMVAYKPDNSVQFTGTITTPLRPDVTVQTLVRLQEQFARDVSWLRSIFFMSARNITLVRAVVHTQTTAPTTADIPPPSEQQAAQLLALIRASANQLF